MPFFLRTVFLLRDLEGWSTEEIAGCLDEDVSQVLRGLNEARMRVVAGLEGCLP
jgi:DNA-directed RNA polymerase specialized sigma24 family protein